MFFKPITQRCNEKPKETVFRYSSELNILNFMHFEKCYSCSRVITLCDKLFLLDCSCEAMPTENVSFMPTVGKPWSTEDLVQKVT